MSISWPRNLLNLLVIAAALLVPLEALAGKRVALVIGNSSYKHAGELANPKNDAADVATVLNRIGFQVIDGFDLDKAALDRKIRDFATALVGAEAGLFFYAGHGLQVGGQNYIVPIDAELTTAAALDFEMVRLDLVHRTMEREAQTNIIFLDACRNNPLERNLRRAMGTRSAEVGRGLAAVESGVGTLISFSTQPGNVALGGSGRNSPFAGALVRHLDKPGDDLSAILIAVRNDVMKETQRQQVPWEHSALTGRFYFSAPGDQKSPPPIGSPAPSPPPLAGEAERTWTLIKDTTSSAVLEAFIKQHGGTVFGELAKARLEDLKRKQFVAVPPPASPMPPSSPTPTPPPPGACTNEALRVSRTVEIDTAGAPGFGLQRYKHHDFLRPKEVVLTFDTTIHALFSRPWQGIARRRYSSRSASMRSGIRKF
jgi:hypothetical protein